MTFADNHNGTGTLSGTPTAGGVFSINFTAQNGIGSQATQSFTLTVNQAAAITNFQQHHIYSRHGRYLYSECDGVPQAQPQ